MKIIYILPIILGLLGVGAQAQQKLADSLYAKSKTFWYNNRDSSIYYLQKALSISRESNYYKGGANALKGLGFLSTSNVERLQYYFKALDIRKQFNDSLGIGVSLHDIGTVYRNLGELEKARDYFARALEIRKKINDFGGTAQSLIEFGKWEEESNDFAKALATYKESLYYRELAKELNGIAYAHINIASAFLGLKQYDSAFYFCNLAEQEFSKVNNKTVSGWTAWIRSMCYEAKNQLDNALSELKGTDSTSGWYNGNILLLSKIYEQKSDFKSAFLYQKKWIKRNELRQKEENTKATRALAADYEYKIQQAEALRKEQQQRQEKSRQDNLQFMLISIGLIAIFTFIVSMRRKFPPRVVDIFTFVGFMFLFEFLVVLIDPSLQELTGNKPVLLLLGNTLVALAIAPMHHFVEKYFKRKVTVSES